jgi:formamidopyrimidine-DNA glycosylase
LGNGVLQDILYLARVHPKTKIAVLSQAKREELFGCVKKVLREIYRLGGRCSEKDLFDQKGGYVPYLSKDTVGSHCVYCGDYILKENFDKTLHKTRATFITYLNYYNTNFSDNDIRSLTHRVDGVDNKNYVLQEIYIT